ncbi:hypothetical protein COCNU_scaffold043638G000010 [Cocos nucifera]|nr:hypothetical protein [Cocos nucifera]
MKLGCLLPLLLGLLVLSSVEEAELFVDRPNSVRIPEHTCQKTIGTVKCKPERCEQECSMQPDGRGECMDDVCSCSFYCQRPPV